MKIITVAFRTSFTFFNAAAQSIKLIEVDANILKNEKAIIGTYLSAN